MSDSRRTRGRWLSSATLVRVVIGALVASALVLSWIRLHAIDYDLSIMTPELVYDVTVLQTFEGGGGEVNLRTYLPVSDGRQTVLDERNSTASLDFQTQTDDDGNRVGLWRGRPPTGPQTATYRFGLRAKAVRYDLDPDIRMSAARPPNVDEKTLSPTDVIQSTHPDVVARAVALTPDSDKLVDYLHAVFDDIQKMGFKPFKGTTDALTAMRLGESSCNGRSRLFVALMRARGLPARLVGGVILTAGDKRTSHQWAEVLVNGHWIPMDTLNHHFAELPHNYLSLYTGDQVLFTHSADIGFSHLLSIKKRMVPRQTLETNKASLGLWAFFSQIGIPLDLLRVVIMIPLGAVVVVIFRNVIGLRTFGTFLPVLIAASARHTGLMWGIVGFVLLILIASGVRRLTARLELLHSPQLAVLLTVVIGTMLFGGQAAVNLGFTSLGRISLFPVAILAISAERFTLLEIEDGAAAAWATMLRTIIVVSACYVAINSLSLQILMLAFPELLLVVAAVNIWLGRWVGLRLSEWVRFKGLIWRGAQA